MRSQLLRDKRWMLTPPPNFSGPKSHGTVSTAPLSTLPLDRNKESQSGTETCPRLPIVSDDGLLARGTGARYVRS